MSFVRTFTNKFIRIKETDIDSYKNHYPNNYYKFAEKLMKQCNINYKCKFHDISYIKPGDFIKLTYEKSILNNYFGYIINIYTHEKNFLNYNSYNIYVFANEFFDCQIIKNINYYDNFIDLIVIPK
jgi:hypothetical protein